MNNERSRTDKEIDEEIERIEGNRFLLCFGIPTVGLILYIVVLILVFGIERVYGDTFRLSAWTDPEGFLSVTLIFCGIISGLTMIMHFLSKKAISKLEKEKIITVKQ